MVQEIVRQVTLDPQGPGVLRLHLIPPGLIRGKSYLLLINGWWVLEVGPSWGRLLGAFMDVLSEYVEPGTEVSQEQLDVLIQRTTDRVQGYYPGVAEEQLRQDLHEILAICYSVAHGQQPSEVPLATIDDLARVLRAPLRMDLIVSPMREGAAWQCPLRCRGCYAAGQPGMEIREGEALTTEQWKRVIDSLLGKVPMLTFTGGEPTERDDLVELVAYASWFVTRLNTSGVNLTPELCAQLREASLDSVQITLYSNDASAHDYMVATKDAWEQSVAGIRNALAAGLIVSVNTPLGPKNREYAKTLEFLHKLGVRYVTCSGWIPAGNAVGLMERGETLSNDELVAVMTEAMETARRLNMELDFTSPGWLTKEQCDALGVNFPTCGACLYNMAVMPNGEVTACQSWLHSKTVFGNILKRPWWMIWNHPACRTMRRAHPVEGCPLSDVEKPAKKKPAKKRVGMSLLSAFPWMILAILFVLTMLTVGSARAQTPPDVIRGYTVTVTPRPDASLDMRYDFDYCATTDFPSGSAYLEVGVPNRHFQLGEYGPSEWVTGAREIKSGESKVHLDFARLPHAGDCFTFFFIIHQEQMAYSVNESDVSFVFTPGWFDFAKIDTLTINWVLPEDATLVKSVDPAVSQEGNPAVWIAQGLAPNKKFTVTVVIAKTAYSEFSEESAAPAPTTSPSTATTSLSCFTIFLIVLGIVVVLFLLYLLLKALEDSDYDGGGYIGGTGGYHGGGGLFGGSDDDDGGDGGGLFGGGGILSGGGGWGGSSGHSSSCACVSSCACACACAGGGRAGCAAKGVTLPQEFLARLGVM